MIIRKATANDIPQMLELLWQLFSIEKDFEPNPVKQFQGLALLLASPNATAFVAECDEQVVGMCTVQILVSTAVGKVVGAVEDVVVNQHHRNEGIGSALLQTLEDWAAEQNLARLQLQADKHNAAALEFYARHGWTTTQLTGLWKAVSKEC
ncbi:MAG: GNAT family N-acetyltransferase [Kiritimatiellales bacterium]|nr:GNAT family N-acetyltransferase [Kiritimatiellales bacterium]